MEKNEPLASGDIGKRVIDSKGRKGTLKALSLFSGELYATVKLTTKRRITGFTYVRSLAAKWRLIDSLEPDASTPPPVQVESSSRNDKNSENEGEII